MTAKDILKQIKYWYGSIQFDEQILKLLEEFSSQQSSSMRWVADRIKYLREQENIALKEIDLLPAGSVLRQAKWDLIRELGYRRNELEMQLRKSPLPSSKGEDEGYWRQRCVELEKQLQDANEANKRD